MTRRRDRRSGSTTLQIIFVLPILLITLIATIQIGFLITLKQAVSHAASVATREAGKGADLDGVVCVVNSVLRPHTLAVGECVGVILEDGDTVEQAGSAPCAPPDSPTLAAGQVRVSVCVDLSKQPFAGSLNRMGICTLAKAIRYSSVVEKE